MVVFCVKNRWQWSLAKWSAQWEGDVICFDDLHCFEGDCHPCGCCVQLSGHTHGGWICWVTQCIIVNLVGYSFGYRVHIRVAIEFIVTHMLTNAGLPYPLVNPRTPHQLLGDCIWVPLVTHGWVALRMDNKWGWVGIELSWDVVRLWWSGYSWWHGDC